MSFRTLISTAALDLHVDESAFVIVDCRFKLDDTSWGEQEYAKAHIPGAVYAHLDRDLSGPKTGTNGRHPLPDAASLRSTFSGLGIGSNMQVVAYDQQNGMFASRLWWMLRWAGHEAVAVLDGGFAKWVAEGRRSRSGIEQRARQEFGGAPRADMITDIQTMEALAGASNTLLIDARAPERYRGETEPLDRVPGHIPGARNFFFQQNVDERGVFHSPERLRDQFRRALGDVDPKNTICYCGSGVTACHNLLALEHAGLAGGRLYPGSWSEWCSDAKRPVERG